ncbi:MAG TPA: tetratricopeptide repeat protein [Rectinemataceae bacterium]|nr:tetratricopeptide repeat protein [Rectinemataceae bacterium]
MRCCHRRLLLVLFTVSVLSSVALAQTAGSAGASTAEDSRTLLERGKSLFAQNRYRAALDAFGQLLADPRASAQRPDAMYWSALAYLGVGDQEGAAASIDAFLAAYPSNPHVPDMLYQRGRILYAKGEYQKALLVFAAFARAAPASDLMPSALYWSGECLYALGRLDEAERAFSEVIEKYPASVKVEAASYRRSLIDLEYRERELLRLLTWSHEEALRAAEDFRRREKAYDQSIALYQRQLADSRRGASTDQDKTVADLRSQVADLGSKLASAQAELEALRKPRGAAVPQATAVPTGPDPYRAQALDAKARALDLLDFYIEQLAKEGSK